MAEEYFVGVENPAEISKTLIDISSLLRRAESLASEIQQIKSRKDDIKELLKAEVGTAISEIEVLYKKAREQEPAQKKQEPREEKPKVEAVHVIHEKKPAVKHEEKVHTVKIKPKEISEESKSNELKSSISAIKNEIARLKKELGSG